MSIKLSNMAIPVTSVLYDDFDERPIDVEFLLPDYCPDIAAVLKCTMTPIIQSKQVSGDRVLVDGIAVLRVLYMDEARKCIRSCEFNQNFTSAFSVKNMPVNCAVRSSAKTNYVNCRATSPRRLDVHGAISVKLKAAAESSNEVVSSLAGDGIYSRKRIMHYSVPTSTAEKSFSITEMVDLGAGKPDAEVLIRGEAVPIITDIKPVQGKVIIKGDLKLKNVYVSDAVAGNMDCVYHDIPFSQIMDVDGLHDDWLVDAEANVVSSDVHITPNSSGESRLLSVNVKINAQVFCTRSGSAEVLVDAYSAKCPMKLENKRLETEQLVGVYRENSSIRQLFDLPPEGIDTIVDVWCDVTPVAERCEEDCAYVDSRLSISMLAKDASGVVSYYERPCDFTLEYDEQCSSMPTNISIHKVDYAMSGSDKLEIRAELGVVRHCYRKDSCMAVCGANEDEAAKFPEEKAAIKIYFANKGESIWEIAKSCHTSMEAVMEENGLSSDVLGDNAMLLVPLC